MVDREEGIIEVFCRVDPGFAEGVHERAVCINVWIYYWFMGDPGGDHTALQQLSGEASSSTDDRRVFATAPGELQSSNTSGYISCNGIRFSSIE